MAFGQHLSADQQGRLAFVDLFKLLFQPALAAGAVPVYSDELGIRKTRLQRILAALGADANGN